MSKVIKDFFSVINTKSFVVIAAACATTTLCYKLNFHFVVPTDLISIAIVFPIVFSIHAAYNRREKALEHYSIFKASALSIRYAHSHWAHEKQKENRENKILDRNEHIDRLDGIYEDLFKKIYDYLHSKKPKSETYDQIITLIGKISLSNEKLRPFVLDPENVRSNENLRLMAVELENIINIKNYRTPNSLRAYTKVFLNIFPIIFGPFFAHVAIERGIEFGLVMATIYSLVLTILDNIQEDLEDPFDGVGSDDIQLNFPTMLQSNTTKD